jgi:hypothetical protein
MIKRYISLGTHTNDRSNRGYFVHFTHSIALSLCTLTLLIPSKSSYADRGHLSASLRGSKLSLDRQQEAAKRAHLKLHKTRREVMRSVKRGDLIRVRSNRYLQLANVSYPYAHPKLHKLLNQLSKLYYRHCKTPLVITSLTRPIHEQPRNASRRSVHPAGIAADLRVPPYVCRKWLRARLTNWESQGLIEATRERRPPHFHIVAMPHKLSAHKLVKLSESSPSKKIRSRSKKRKIKHRKSHRRRSYQSYRVRRGDSIWKLARKWHVSETSIKRLNHLKTSRIDYGQTLLIPKKG